MKSLLLGLLLFCSTVHAQVTTPAKAGAKNFKTSVANPASLPLTGNTAGDSRVSLSNASLYIWDGASWQGIVGGGASLWGAITGTLSNQTDLNTALNGKEPTITAATAAEYFRGDKTFQTLNTTAVPEGTNLYFTNGRFDTRFGLKTTTDLAEGTNLYYTDGRFDTRLGTKSTTDLAEGTNLYYTQGRFDTAFTAKDTDDLSEGATNLYFTNGRAQSAVVTQAITNGVTTTAPSEDAVFDALALKQSTSEKDQNNGYAGLDAGGKIAISALPNTVMTFEGQWNATTNTPALADGAGNAGDVYRANVAGTTNFGSGPIAFNLGDWAVYNGTVWEYAANSNLVMSVNGQQGVVVLGTDDIAEGTNLYFTEARVRSTPLTGFTSGAGVVAATDTVLQAFEKLDGNINAVSSGVAYGMAGFDSAGALYEIPNMFHTDYNGLYGTVQVPVAGDLNILSLSSASGVAPANVNGIFINNQAESTTNTTLLDLSNAAPIGDDFAGMRIFNSGNSVDALTMQSIGNSGNYGGQLRLMEASNSGTGAGGILYNIFNNGAQSGQLTVLNVGDSGNNTADTTLLALNENGNITGNFQGIGFGTNGDVTGNSTLATIGDNGNVVGGDFMGLNLYGGSTTTGNSLMQNITDNGSSVNKTGIGVSLSGSASNSVNGLYVNVDNVTFAGQKSSGTFSGGLFSSQSNIDTGDFTPPFFTNNNSLGGQLQIDSGSPLLATPMFGNNLGIVVNFDDDYTADDFISVGNSLGYSVNGFVNQVTGASGKTMDTLNYMFAAGSNPTGAGTIENLNFFRAGGLLNAGGTLTATNQRAFYVDPAFDGSVATTNKWGFINASSSNNWMKGSLTVGGSSGANEAGVELDVDGEVRIRSLTTAGYVTTDASGHLTSVAIPSTPVSSNITANTTLASTTRYYLCDTTGGAFTVTLPAAASNNGIAFTVKHTTFGGANDVTVATGETIDGEVGDTLTAGEGKTYISNGTSWFTSL
jgi:hypothetical protein